ncbi:MAG: 50S ribosomal protein L18 [Lactobacillales bacterium]|jgi:large subunit ribosomal protein L18|nr:50S ribosomal protein L18 [Lactobacillales bacterium]
MVKLIEKQQRRKRRVRYALKKNSAGRPRVSVHRSDKHIYVQLIDDKKGITIASASSLDKEIKEKGSTVAGAAAVGTLLAQRAVKAGVKEVAFDRGGYVYHGRIKALAEAARAAGLSF